MKTTVELPDALLRRARRHALRERTTVRALIERGLRHVLADDRAPFRLKDASFSGGGLTTGRSLADWEDVRDLIYKDRGA
jgi:hypothetical protein